MFFGSEVNVEVGSDQFTCFAYVSCCATWLTDVCNILWLSYMPKKFLKFILYSGGSGYKK